MPDWIRTALDTAPARLLVGLAVCDRSAVDDLKGRLLAVGRLPVGIRRSTLAHAAQPLAREALPAARQRELAQDRERADAGATSLAEMAMEHGIAPPPASEIDPSIRDALHRRYGPNALAELAAMALDRRRADMEAADAARRAREASATLQGAVVNMTATGRAEIPASAKRKLEEVKQRAALRARGLLR